MIIIADSSPLIGFAILGKLEILNHIFEHIYVPQAVYDEVTVSNKPYSDQLKLFLKDKVKDINNDIAVKLLRSDLDPGEAESIVLAIEKSIENILIDDPRGRRAARVNGLHPIGTVGVLVRAKRLNLIASVKPLLDELIKSKIRIGKGLYEKALDLAGETND